MKVKSKYVTPSINPPALFRSVPMGRKEKSLLTLTYKKTATKNRILVAIVLWNKELPEYLYQ
jgi:hypothetical protein